jgi:hypothetical protein
MFKFFAYCTLAVLACLTTAFLAKYLPYAVESFTPLKIAMNSTGVTVTKNATRRLEYLNELVEMPLVGSFFL